MPAENAMLRHLCDFAVALSVSLCLVPGIARAAPAKDPKTTTKTTTKSESKIESKTTTTVTEAPDGAEPEGEEKEEKSEAPAKEENKLGFQAARHAKRVEAAKKALKALANAALPPKPTKAIEDARQALVKGSKPAGSPEEVAACKSAVAYLERIMSKPAATPYATCVAGSCDLTPLAHARILADWGAFRSELEDVPTAARDRVQAACKVPLDASKKNAFGKPSLPVSVEEVGGKLASAVYGSVAASFDAVREWSEAAIKRRLEREVVLALVDRLAREFCTEPTTKMLLPRTCSLANDDALAHVSAGSAQLGIIRSAVKGDLSELPARAFVTEDDVLPTLPDGARDAFFRGLRHGESPAVLMRDLVDVTPGPGAGATNSTPTQAFACYAELGTSAIGYVDALSEQGDELAVSAAYLAAMMTSERCDGTVLGAGSVQKVVDAWEKSEELEGLARQWRIAEAAAKAYDESAEGIALGDAAAKNEKEEDGGDDAGENVEVDVTVNLTEETEEKDDKKKDDEKEKAPSPAQAVREARSEAARAHAQVAIRYGRALVGLSRGSTDIVNAPSKSSRCPADSVCKKADQALGAFAARIDLTEHVVVEDWQSLVAEVTRPTAAELVMMDPATRAADAARTAALDETAKAAKATREATAAEIQKQRKALRKLSGLLTAISTEESPDEILVAVQAAALPAASWRTKMRANAFTVSFGMYLGVTGGVEFRYGTYGATFNDGQAAAIVPTLFAPIGLDVSWARDAVRRMKPKKGEKWKRRLGGGMFFPLVDPAAFLQYDIHAQGRLPGPRLTTILSPGIALRISMADSALSAMLYGVFRPQLRTWC